MIIPKCGKARPFRYGRDVVVNPGSRRRASDCGPAPGTVPGASGVCSCVHTSQVTGETALAVRTSAVWGGARRSRSPGSPTDVRGHANSTVPTAASSSEDRAGGAECDDNGDGLTRKCTLSKLERSPVRRLPIRRAPGVSPGKRDRITASTGHFEPHPSPRVHLKTVGGPAAATMEESQP